MAANKHGPALTERELERRARLQAETIKSVERFKNSVANFRDSIDTSDLLDYDSDNDRPTSPTIIVNVQKSHRPVDAKTVESESLRPEGIKRKLVTVGVIAVGVGTAVVTVLRALGVIK